MNKKIWSIAAGCAATCALTFGVATSASAFPIYEDTNYGGYDYQAKWAEKDGLGTINKKGSSMKNSPGKLFFEKRGYTGRKVFIQGNVQHLSKLKTNLAWYESWNDRIQSYK